MQERTLFNSQEHTRRTSRPPSEALSRSQFPEESLIDLNLRRIPNFPLNLHQLLHSLFSQSPPTPLSPIVRRLHDDQGRDGRIWRNSAAPWKLGPRRLDLAEKWWPGQRRPDLWVGTARFDGWRWQIGGGSVGLQGGEVEEAGSKAACASRSLGRRRIKVGDGRAKLELGAVGGSGTRWAAVQRGVSGGGVPWAAAAQEARRESTRGGESRGEVAAGLARRRRASGTTHSRRGDDGIVFLAPFSLLDDDTVVV